MIISKYVKMGERGQIVIPKEIREKENLLPNQALKIVYTAGSITIRVSSISETPEEKIERALKSVGLTRKDWEDIQKDRKER